MCVCVCLRARANVYVAVNRQRCDVNLLYCFSSTNFSSYVIFKFESLESSMEKQNDNRPTVAHTTAKQKRMRDEKKLKVCRQKVLT